MKRSTDPVLESVDESPTTTDIPSEGGAPALVGDDGMTTAEYAVGTIAAVAFAAVLYKIVQSPQVHDMLTHLVTSALNIRL